MNLFNEALRYLFYKKIIFILGLFFISLLWIDHANASAASYAYDSDGSWGWSTNQTQTEADKNALSICNSNSTYQNCVVDTTKAIARAEYKNTIGYGRSSVGVMDARKQALQACGRVGCRVTLIVSDPGFYSLVRANSQVYFFLTYGFSNSDEAGKSALKNCTTMEGEGCQVIWSGSIAGQIKTP